jgi:hypothetical protein
VITNPKKGLYPHAGQYRSEVLRALTFAGTVWGVDKAWASLERSDWVALMRERLQQLVREQHQGVAGTQHTIIRLITVLRWLKEEGRIPESVPSPKRDWKDQVAKEWMQLTKAQHGPVVRQPRYTLEELLTIMAHAWKIDPRFGLLTHLGAGLRLGQVRRAMRSHLKLVPTDDRRRARAHGAFPREEGRHDRRAHARPARGRRGDAYRACTPRSRSAGSPMVSTTRSSPPAAWRGSSGGRRSSSARSHRSEVALTKKMRPQEPVSDRWWQKRWGEAETLAGVPYIAGRASYGGRRIFVDEALDRDVSDRALKSLGGWTSAVVPKGVYADKESRTGRREARDVRVAILGETNVPSGTAGANE